MVKLFLKQLYRFLIPTASFLLFLCLTYCLCVFVAQSCPTLCDRMDCSLPGSSVHGILQARILEWVAIPFSRGPSKFDPGIIKLRSATQQTDSLPSEPPGKAWWIWILNCHFFLFGSRSCLPNWPLSQLLVACILFFSDPCKTKTVVSISTNSSVT